MNLPAPAPIPVVHFGDNVVVSLGKCEKGPRFIPAHFPKRLEWIVKVRSLTRRLDVHLVSSTEWRPLMDIVTSSGEIGGRLRVCKRAPLVIHSLGLEPEQATRIIQSHSMFSHVYLDMKSKKSSSSSSRSDLLAC